MLTEIVPPVIPITLLLNQVREATSNDPWGPSSSLMSEIADLTFNVVAFAEVMGMVWKRLNDHGKNWRHVYKVNTFKETPLRLQGKH
uniref:ENTH domain-containing protein n=1 Tax=Hucho hucho TaxID=62062 RepID=A0A4W5LKC9_9TELE